LAQAQGEVDRLELRLPEVNETAQKFYEKFGFREAGRGDGAENDENLPDIH